MGFDNPLIHKLKLKFEIRLNYRYVVFTKRMIYVIAKYLLDVVN